MPSNTALPCSARTPLSPRIVAPPKLDAGGNIVFQKGHVRPNSAHFIPGRQRQYPAPPSTALSVAAPVPQKLLETVMAMKESAHAVTDGTDEATKQSIASWPALRTSRLLQSLQAQLIGADALGDSAALRAERLVAMLNEVGDEMVSYKAVFQAFGKEVQLLVTHLADATLAVEESQSAREEVEKRLYGELRQQHSAMNREIRMLQQTIQDRKAESEAVLIQLGKLRAAQVEMVKDKKLLLQKEEEVAANKIVFDALELEYAKRIKELSDRFPVMEEEVRLSQNKSEELHASNVRLTAKVASLERQVQRAKEVHTSVTAKLEDTIADLRSQNRRLSQSLQALRVIKHQTDDELAAAKVQLEKAETENKESRLLLTPRPTFPEDVQRRFVTARRGTSAGALSSHDKVAQIVRLMLEAEEERRVTTDENDTLRLSLAIPRPLEGMKRGTALAAAAAAAGGGLCTAALQLKEAPSGGIMSVADLSTPPMLHFKTIPTITVRPLPAKDAVLRCKELLDMVLAAQTRSSKTVELHAYMLASMIDSFHYGAMGDAVGRYDPPPSGLVPPVVYEQCAAILLTLSTAASHPVVETFGLVLREEVGCWLWGAQNDFVARVVMGLSRTPVATMLEYKETLRHVMVGFPEPFIIAAQHQFAAAYGTNGGGCGSPTSPGSPKDNPLARRARRESRVGILTPPDSDGAIVQFPVTADMLIGAAALDVPFLNMMRRIFNAAVLCSYSAFDTALAQILTGSGRARLTRGTMVDEPTAIAALTLVFPGRDRANLVRVCDAVFATCALQYKLEVHLRDEPLGGMYGGPELGLASHQIFLPGATAVYCGAFADYPVLLPTVAGGDGAALGPGQLRRWKSSTTGGGGGGGKLERSASIAPNSSLGALGPAPSSAGLTSGKAQPASDAFAGDDALPKPTKATAPYHLFDRMYRKLLNPMLRGSPVFVYSF